MNHPYAGVLSAAQFAMLAAYEAMSLHDVVESLTSCPFGLGEREAGALIRQARARRAAMDAADDAWMGGEPFDAELVAEPPEAIAEAFRACLALRARNGLSDIELADVAAGAFALPQSAEEVTGAVCMPLPLAGDRPATSAIGELMPPVAILDARAFARL